MAVGRTLDKWARVYWEGYDISGVSRSIGACGIAYAEPDLTTLGDAVKGYQAGMPAVNCTAINGVLDNTATTGLHTVAQTAGAKRTLLIAYGQLAEPAQGDVCFGGQFTQGAYQANSDGGAMVVTMPFQGWAGDATFNFNYRPFGILLHALSAVTAVNSAVGVDDNSGATTQSGYMVYHVTASSGAGHTATLKVQDAAVNTDVSFADITGCTTGVITVTAGVSGIVKATVTAIRQFVRFQIVLGTATSVTFALSFNRG